MYDISNLILLLMKKIGICIILLGAGKLIKKNIKCSDKEVQYYQYSNVAEVIIIIDSSLVYN